MLHQKWLQEIKDSLNEIKEKYPNGDLPKKSSLKIQLLKVKKTCDQILESWILIEEEIAHLMNKYPELAESNEQYDEEIWLTPSVVRHFRQGQGYYGLTMFCEARSLFEKVVEGDPDFILGRIYLGLSEFQENRLEKAMYHFCIVSDMSAKERFAGFAEHMIGCISVKLGEDIRAIKHFSKAITILPDHSDAWFNLGASYYRLGKYQEAIANFYQALSINKDDWESMYYLSNCYRQYREWGNVSYWRMASYEKTNHPQIIESIANDYEEMNKPDEAIHWYHRLLDLDRKNPRAFHGISWNFWVKNEIEESIFWIKRGLTLFPNDESLLFTFVWLCMAKGDVGVAIRTLDNLPDDLVENPLWIAAGSRLFTQIGDFDQALGMAESLIEQERPSIQALGYYQKGKAFMEMNNTVEAVRHFQKASQLNLGWREPIFFEGICHMVEGKKNQMQDCWNRLNLV